MPLICSTKCMRETMWQKPARDVWLKHKSNLWLAWTLSKRPQCRALRVNRCRHWVWWREGKKPDGENKERHKNKRKKLSILLIISSRRKFWLSIQVPQTWRNKNCTEDKGMNLLHALWLYNLSPVRDHLQMFHVPVLQRSCSTINISPTALKTRPPVVQQSNTWSRRLGASFGVWHMVKWKTSSSPWFFVFSTMSNTF